MKAPDNKLLLFINNIIAILIEGYLRSRNKFHYLMSYIPIVSN